MLARVRVLESNKDIAMWNRSYVLLAGLLLPCTFVAAQSQPDPIDIYRQAAARVAAATAMSFHVEKRYDVVLLDGAKVEYSGALDAFANSAGGFFPGLWRRSQQPAWSLALLSPAHLRVTKPFTLARLRRIDGNRILVNSINYYY